MVAERALLNNILGLIKPTDAGSCAAFRIAVGAGCQAALATDAILFVDENNIVILIAISGTSRTGGNTG
jgi:hypothetical protein